MKYPTYSVAIRTLGKAGEKYQAELDSLVNQTLKAEAINVYIPNGYDIPKETMGREKYYRCDKGMVAQRALPFREITSDYILFLDDDIVLPPNAVEDMFDKLVEKGGECISVSFEPPESITVNNILKRAIISGWYPHRDRNIAWKIGINGEYTFCVNPNSAVLATGCLCFAIILISKSAYDKLSFNEEKWLDAFGYSVHDEAVFGYKLLSRGIQPYLYFADGYHHLDARCGHSRVESISDAKKFGCRLAVWYRLVYSRKSRGILFKTMATMAFSLFMLRQYILRGLRCLALREPQFLWLAICELRNAWRLIHSEPYKSLEPLGAVL